MSKIRNIIGVFILLLISLTFNQSFIYSKFLTEPNNLWNKGINEVFASSFNSIALNSPLQCDVYTERGGQGHNTQSDAYGPQELITMYGYVTYNNVSVPNIALSFEIADKNGNSFAYLTAITDNTGIAKVQLRLPWSNGPNPEINFGTWTIYAVASNNQFTVSDTCSFKFDYILQILNAQIMDNMDNPQYIFALNGQTQTVVYFKNIRSVSLNAVISVTLFDKNQVPINSGFIRINVPPNMISSVKLMLTIPNFATLGSEARSSVNIFNKLPHDQGVAFSSEKNIKFTIVN